MKIKNVLLAVVVTMLIINPAVSVAALIVQDWKVQGDNGITLDTETGLRWLDLTYSFNMSPDSVASELDGGIFSGFRVATYLEEMTLRQHAGITLSVNQLPSTDSVQVEAVRMYQVLLANVESTSIFNHPYTDMGTMAANLDGSIPGGYGHFRFNPAGTWREVPSVGYWGGSQATDSAEPWIGTLLVAIPEPSIFILFGLGGLLIRKHKFIGEK